MRLKTEEVAPFVSEVLFDEGRDRPVVALTTDPRTGHSLVDVHRIVREVGDRAIVVELETGDATWALSEALPPRLDVYGGAARIWWPGLTPGANPYDHRLYFVYSDEDARRVEEHLLSAVDGSTGDAPAPNDAPLHPVAAVVSKVEGERIEVTLGEQRGVVVEADLPLGIIAGCMKVGVEVEVWQLEQAKDDVWKCSIAGLLPDSWQVLKSSVRVGDVLMGRAQNVLADKGLVFVDVLPGAVGVCHISELHFDHVRDMSEYIESGEIVAFEVLAMDFAEMRLQLSRKRAFTRDAGPSPSLVPGGAPFVWTQGMPLFESLRRKAQRGEGRRTRLRVVGQQPTQQGRLSPDAAEQVESLTAELQAAIEQRANLVKEIRSLREQVGQAKKDLRSAEDRFDNLARKTSSEVDPLSSERAFSLAVRLCYARMYGEGDRQEHPLRRMRIGASFLESVRDLEGVSLEKIVEVCAQVACGAAATVPAREVHQLRDRPRGAGGRTRDADGAKAWRCSLQDNTASARRLHWWSVPGDDGGVVEFACVGLHDSYGIPE